jgi:hypothetical protein
MFGCVLSAPHFPGHLLVPLLEHALEVLLSCLAHQAGVAAVLPSCTVLSRHTISCPCVVCLHVTVLGCELSCCPFILLFLLSEHAPQVLSVLFGPSGLGSSCPGDVAAAQMALGSCMAAAPLASLDPLLAGLGDWLNRSQVGDIWGELLGRCISANTECRHILRVT